jgi:hypothetical protein
MTPTRASAVEVESVRAALIGLGVSTLDMVGTALGTSNPLPEGTGAERARANRSVVFTVRIAPQFSGAGVVR